MLRQAKIFSKLDLRNAFFQVRLAPESRHLTAFQTPDGLKQYCRLPMGMKSSSSCFQYVGMMTLGDIDGVIVFQDDILISGATQSEHDERMLEVLKRLNERDARVNHEKCEFNKREIQFLGHLVSADGIKPLPKNVDALLKMPEPTDVQTLQTVIGMAGFYTKFVHEFSSIVEPLRALLRGNADFAWTPECSKAFTEIKQRIASYPVLAYYDPYPNCPTYVTTDSSGRGLGAVLSQVLNGVERPVAFASKTLSENERKYGVPEMEALACIWACKRWE